MPNKLHYKTKRTFNPSLGMEINEQPSQTVQNETESIQELLVKYSQGMQINRKVMTYFDNEDLETINRFYSPGQLDLTDIDKLNDHVQHLQASIDRAKQQRDIEIQEEKAKQAELDQEIKTEPKEEN